MQSAQYGAFSDVDMLGNMWNDLATSGDWADGIMAHSNIPFNNSFSQQHHHYIPNYDLNYTSLDDDQSLSSGATMSLEMSTDSSVIGSSPSLFSPPTSHALRRPIEVKQTISPLQSDFNFNDPQSASCNVDLNSEPQSALSSSSFTTSSQASSVGSHTRNDSIHSLKREADSSDDDDTKPHSPKKLTTSTRRRRSTLKDTKDADSARAIYLEKNRVAASKCRNRQKRKEEKLVEKAREVKRKHKELKHEAEFLQKSMRDLMEHVARHSDCSDHMLATYIQRKADRLTASGVELPAKLSDKESSAEKGSASPKLVKSD